MRQMMSIQGVQWTNLSLIVDAIDLQMTSEAAPSSKAIAFHFKNGVENPATSLYYPASTLKHIFFNDIDSEVKELTSHRLESP